MSNIIYKVGDATDPNDVEGCKILVHIVNSVGAFGAGFVVALSNRWPQPESVYRSLTKEGLVLGDIQIVQVAHDIIVVNMVAQILGYSQGPDGKMIPPIRYEALRACLEKVCCLAQGLQAASDETISVIGPRFGSALAGGDWRIIEKIVKETLCDMDIPVFIYDLPERH